MVLARYFDLISISFVVQVTVFQVFFSKHFHSFCIMHDFYVGYISTNLSMILLAVPNLLSFCLICQAAFTPEDLYTRKRSLDLQVGQVLGTGFSVFFTLHVAQLEDKPGRYDLSRFSFCLAIVDNSSDYHDKECLAM
jgi:hypothetical protein